METSGQGIVVAILAGGKSSRMHGQDKALIRVDGMSLIKRAVIAASSVGLPVIIVGRDSADFGNALNGLHAQVLPDALPHQGPLGGLHTAMLCQSPDKLLLLCACDLPLISGACFSWLESEAGQTDFAHFDGIVPTWQGRPEPLFAIYARTLLPTLNELLNSDRSMHALLHSGQFRFIPLPADLTGAISDVDTPEELDLILQEGRPSAKIHLGKVL